MENDDKLKDRSYLDVLLKIEDVEIKMSATNKRKDERHKNVTCLSCARTMRSNNLKRHSKTHTDLLSLPENKIHAELTKRKIIEDKREERIQLIKKIAIEKDLSPDLLNLPTTTSSITTLEGEILKYHESYLQDIEKGRQIYNILCKGVASEDSLPKPYKQCLDSFTKNKPSINIATVQLRPWQAELVQHINTPAER